MKFAGWNLWRKWPTVDWYMPGSKARGEIKTLSVTDLERLQLTASANPWSAVGRPAWVRGHKDRIRDVMLNIFVVEHPSVYRCLVTVILDDGSGGQFTLEVAFKDFNRLPNITPKRLVDMAHRYLGSLPFIDLDPDQAESWKHLENDE